jgi:uncharacterized membrane protein YeaQ/YmgE (transglycosylase-associated protein family)
MDIVGLIGFIVFGLVVGAIAKFLMPGPDPGGWVATTSSGWSGPWSGGWWVGTSWGAGRGMRQAGSCRS